MSKKVAIIVGHTKESQGAVASAPLSLSEWRFNDEVADHMLRLCASGLELKKFYRRQLPGRVSYRYGKEMRELYARVSAWHPDATAELHFNDFGTTEYGGYEVIVSGSNESNRLGQAFLDQGNANRFKTTNRGLKVRGSKDRGGLSVHLAPCPSVLLEPFNCRHRESLEAIHRMGTEGLAKIYLDALYQWARISPGSVRQASSLPANFPVHFTFEGLTKDEWFKANAQAIRKLPVSPECFCALAYAELGITGGYVDPQYKHSLGERGALPLPSNYAYWTGEQLPEKLTDSENIVAFAGYLEAIQKSKIYGYLFDECETEAQRARVLAGCVHGWFYSGAFEIVKGLNLTYADIALPKRALAYAARHSDGDEPDMILTILEELRYKHDATLITNRLRNIDRGLDIALTI